jgi:hypothetical protein
MPFKQYYTDVTPDKWYYKEIERGTFYGLLEGGGHGLYSPDTPMTRAEAGAAVTRSFEHTMYITLLANGIILSALLFTRR